MSRKTKRKLKRMAEKAAMVVGVLIAAIVMIG